MKIKRLATLTLLTLLCPLFVLAGEDECFKWHLLNQTHKILLANTCPDCKIAVVLFKYYNGKHETKEFEVPGKGSIEIDKTGADLDIINHKDCKKK